MKKILITGGSGFIGTNLIDYLLSLNFQVINYDIKFPRKKSQCEFWKNIDICDFEILKQNLLNDNPDYIIHLAARTDLDEYININAYEVNFKGVRNLMESAKLILNLKRILVASSMLVCKLGYHPSNFDDYFPDSLYGESKVLTEKIVKEYTIDWVIIRPTSIWGPWFDKPYKTFFDLVTSGFYFNIPDKYSSTKTYGFVENSCIQIVELLFTRNVNVKHNYFYIGDEEPINISNWASRIRNLNNQKKLIVLPKYLLKILAIIGDFLIKFLKIKSFPMNSFRFKNMTTDNIIFEVSKINSVMKNKIESRLDLNIIKTLNWIKINKKNI